MAGVGQHARFRGKPRMAKAVRPNHVVDFVFLADLLRAADILDDFKRSSAGLDFDPA